MQSGAALEGAADATVVLFDKTGTLTQGTPRVVGTVYMDDTHYDAAAATAAVAACRDGARSESMHQWIWSAIAAAEMQVTFVATTSTVSIDTHSIDVVLINGIWFSRSICSGARCTHTR